LITGITGITGMVGSHLPDYLLAETDWEIAGLARWRSPLDNIEQHLDRINRGDRIRLVYGDLRDYVSIWGDGSAQRDFLYIDDCIEAMVRLLDQRFSGVVNVATGRQTAIRELAEALGRVSGFDGAITYDTSMPSGQMGRRFDTSIIESTGWAPQHDLDNGLRKTVTWFESHRAEIHER
jgi:nucleoside-diphosphate-sugar epimerase